MSDLPPVSEGVERVLRQFLTAREAEVAAIDDALPALVVELLAVIESGGKRLRPWLATWGYRAAGRDLDEPMLAAAAALELVHTFALLQDDFMDASGMRRGRTATHVTMGPSAAVLISDLALVWADQLLAGAGFSADRLAEGRTIFNALRAEVTLGQYMDLAGPVDEEHALKVNRYKTASYTVLRPIQLGMVLGGASRRLVEMVPAYAEPAGIAFQLRDDVLGAFGDAALTGKPAGEDLRNRKPTWLWARARRRAGEPPEGVEARRRWVRASGALTDAELLMRRLEGEAERALDLLPVARELKEELRDMTRGLVERST